MEVPSIRTGTEVEFRHLWGKTKRAQLLDTLPYDRRTLYEEITPILSLGLPIMPIHSNAYYLDWPLLPELLPALFPGVQTKRDELVVDIDHDRLLKRMKQYFDPNITDEQMKRICARAMETTARFDAAPVREYLVKRGMLPEYFVPYLYRPFDIRWIYWEPETRLLGEKVSAYFPHVFEGNVWIVSQQKPRREWSMPQFTRHLGCLDVMDRGASFIPLYLRENKGTKSLFDGHELQDARLQDGGRWLNISDAAMQYLNSIGTLEDAESLFYHALSVLHTPMYRTENSGALRQDWPRIPLPDSLDLLKASAALGRQVAALFDTEKPVPGVTTTPIRPEIKAIGAITRVGGGSLDPATDDLAITAGWGHAGSGGVTMPAKGRWVERDYTPEEKAAMGVGIVASSGADPVLCAFGEKTFDVYLNDVAYWRNIPERVWGYTIGGYQVIKKWLSYRERTLLGRALTEEEVTEVTQTARRITALLLLEAALDANYTAVKSATSR